MEVGWFRQIDYAERERKMLNYLHIQQPRPKLNGWSGNRIFARRLKGHNQALSLHNTKIGIEASADRSNRGKKK